MRLIKSFLIGIFLFTAIGLYAQQQRVGCNIGYGKTDVSDDFKQDSYKRIKGDFFTFGGTYSYSPGHALFDLGGGLSFSYRNIENMQLHYVRIPISFDLRFGGNFQPTIGAGVSVNFLIASDVDESKYNFESTKNNFHSSVFLRGGFIYVLNPRYSLKLRYTYGFDITSIYTTADRSGALGRSTPEGMYGRDQYITVGLDITLSGKIAD